VAVILSMPKWGLAMKMGKVVGWLKQPGDTVQQGEPIVEIESEKATNEVASPITGVLRWLEVQEEQEAPVGATLAVLTAPGEELSDEQVVAFIREDTENKQRQAAALSQQKAASKAATATRTTSAATRSAVRPGGRINASPAARRLAQELGVDLATVAGTGPNGMIGREDVLHSAREASTAPSDEAEEQDINVAGHHIHYLTAGSINTPHVVFVHGLGGSLTTWSLNLAAFAEHFRICALDLIGAGDSAKPDTDYSIPALASFLARFLDALGPEWQKVSLIGHSLGGAIALTCAASHSQRVERLVLVDSTGLGPEINQTVLNLMQAEPTRERLRSELSYFFARPGQAQQALIDQLYQQRTQPDAHEALVTTARAAFADGKQQNDLRATLANLSIPVLAIWGDLDAVVPVDHAQAASQAPHSHVEILTGCGHCPHIERADEFNRQVISFLQNS
jgi:pyruvate dehydrogenase E2 component (dihydrolipoamide acetyltransferase)